MDCFGSHPARNQVVAPRWNSTVSAAWLLVCMLGLRLGFRVAHIHEWSHCTQTSSRASAIILLLFVVCRWCRQNSPSWWVGAGWVREWVGGVGGFVGWWVGECGTLNPNLPSPQSFFSLHFSSFFCFLFFLWFSFVCFVFLSSALTRSLCFDFVWFCCLCYFNFVRFYGFPSFPFLSFPFLFHPFLSDPILFFSSLFSVLFFFVLLLCDRFTLFCLTLCGFFVCVILIFWFFSHRVSLVWL